jgi:DNA repair exonuclease SbcCD ATPase subunit
MFFSIGDIITLVVVLVVLAIYRAMDRNNRSLEKLKRFSDKITENLSAQVQAQTAQVRDLTAELQNGLKSGKEILARARAVDEILQARAADVEAIQKRFTEYDHSLEELTNMSARVDKNLAKIRDESEFVDSIGRAIAESAQHLQKLERQVPELEKSFASQAREQLAAAGTEAAAGFEERVGRMGAVLAETDARVKDFASYLSRLSASEDQIQKERLASLAKSMDAFEADLRGRLAAAAAKGESLEDEVFQRLSARIQGDEAAITKSIEVLEARVSDYQGDVDYRVKSLEESSGDIEALRSSLGQSLEKMAAGVRSEMKAAAAELVAGWTSEIAAAAAARDQLRSGMAELESSVSSLKARAYQDVEQKLSAFEDEFFADLRGRSAAMLEKVKAWQADTERRAAEFEADVKGRVIAAEESIQTLRDSLRGDSEKARKEASQAFEKELSAVRDALEASTRKMHREIEAGVKDMAAELDAGRKELAELMESSRSEVAAWETRARQQLAETELAIADKISTLSAEAVAAIGGIRDSFNAQREDIIVSSNEERTALRAELASMAESITAAKGDLAGAARAGMEALRGQLDAFQLESQKRLRDLQAEADARTREHKQQLSDAREKTEAMQEKLFGKVEESYRLLSVNVGEVDKRLKGFLSQTRLFERADSLKAALEGSIDEMKKELARLGAERTEITEIEAQLARTRKTSDEVAAKLTRFLAEKRRIEDMDGEFKKIITLSKDVDLKLDTLSSSNDALQQIQAKIRQFEEMGKAVEGGFERLEKKKEIISITSEGVDKNFARLEGIERTLQDADRAADDLAGRMQSLRSEYDALASNKKDAESAMETVGKLQGIMAELEGRLEKAQSAREWMARTETRFEEIGRQAQEQVRLLEAIVKTETKKDKSERGAPPLDKRETVVKLSHQGWSVQEISKVTQLSRGEVELILELAPKV